jgi:hypothetical protein
MVDASGFAAYEGIKTHQAILREQQERDPTD